MEQWEKQLKSGGGSGGVGCGKAIETCKSKNEGAEHFLRAKKGSLPSFSLNMYYLRAKNQ